MLNGYLLDSDVIIDFLRHKQEAVDLLKTLIGQGSVGCSSLSIIEVAGGMRPSEEKATYALLRGLKLYPVSEKIGWLAAQQQRKLREKGITVGAVDAAQAAICLSNNLALVTSNKRHYKDIKELQVL